MGLGEFFSLASAVIWACAVIMFTRIGAKLPAFELNFIKNHFGLILLLLTALIFESVNHIGYSLNDWLIISLSGILGIAIADTLYIRALNLIGAGSTGVVAALYSPFVVFLSLFYLQESLSFFQWLGLVSVLCGVTLISTDKSHKDVGLKDKIKGISFGVLSVFLTALGVVLMKPILEVEPFFWTTTLRLLIGLVSMYFFIVATKRITALKMILSSPQNWKAISIASVLSTYIAMTFWLAGYKYTDASIASILNESTSLFIVLLAWLFLKETLSFKKVSGVTFALVGVSLVIFAR